jgi:hypothetical protein
MDIKQIFSLHIDGLSNRKIAQTLGLSSNWIFRSMLTPLNRNVFEQ